MFGERFREEYASRIDQQADVFVFGINGIHHVLHTLFFHQVSHDDGYLPVCRQRLTSLLGFVLRFPTSTTLPPFFRTSFAVSKPIPLVPPTTNSFLPAKDAFIANLFKTYGCH
jgi:hypothetical protein